MRSMKFWKFLGGFLVFVGFLAALTGILATAAPMIDNDQVRRILESFSVPSQDQFLDAVNSALLFCLGNNYLLFGAGAGAVLLGGLLKTAADKAMQRANGGVRETAAPAARNGRRREAARPAQPEAPRRTEVHPRPTPADLSPYAAAQYGKALAGGTGEDETGIAAKYKPRSIIDTPTPAEARVPGARGEAAQRCLSCGAENPAGASFCDRCGARMSAPGTIERNLGNSPQAKPTPPLQPEQFFRAQTLERPLAQAADAPDYRAEQRDEPATDLWPKPIAYADMPSPHSTAAEAARRTVQADMYADSASAKPAGDSQAAQPQGWRHETAQTDTYDFDLVPPSGGMPLAAPPTRNEAPTVAYRSAGDAQQPQRSEAQSMYADSAWEEMAVPPDGAMMAAPKTVSNAVQPEPMADSRFGARPTSLADFAPAPQPTVGNAREALADTLAAMRRTPVQSERSQQSPGFAVGPAPAPYSAPPEPRYTAPAAVPAPVAPPVENTPAKPRIVSTMGKKSTR